MKYKLYTSSKKSWKAMIESIKRARKCIYIEMYIFMDDTSEKFDFLSALKEKALQGLEVVLVVDSFGSMDIKKETIKSLKESGVEFLFFSNWLRRTHRKILLIDNQIAFLGGVNIKKNSSDWIDLQVRLSNKVLVKNILRSFAYTYQMSGGKNVNILNNRKRSVLKTIRAQFLEHWPSHKIYALQAYYQEKILSAQKNIVIVTPYFTPPRWLMALLESVALRGVKIDIIIPNDTDIKLLNRINRIYINKLSDLGINFYSQRKMNHAKILLIDDLETLIGSQNLDIFSFKLNIESGVFIRDKNLIAELGVIIEKWKKDSSFFPREKRRESFFDKIYLWVIKIFYSIL